MSGSCYDLILFDVDHTLFDFEASEERALNLCWEHYFPTATDLETFTYTFRKLSATIWHELNAGKIKPSHLSKERARRVLKAFGFSGGKAGELGRLFEQGLGEVAKWMPGAESGFHNLARRYRVGVITNGLSVVQHLRLNAMGIKPLLCTVQISEEAGIMKPRAEIFFRAIREAGGSLESTLMVGDSVSSDFQGAINAGIDFCWVKPDRHDLPFHFPQPKYQLGDVSELSDLLLLQE